MSLPSQWQKLMAETMAETTWAYQVNGRNLSRSLHFVKMYGIKFRKSVEFFDLIRICVLFTIQCLYFLIHQTYISLWWSTWGCLLYNCPPCPKYYWMASNSLSYSEVTVAQSWKCFLSVSFGRASDWVNHAMPTLMGKYMDSWRGSFEYAACMAYGKCFWN